MIAYASAIKPVCPRYSMVIERRCCIAILVGLMALWPIWTRAQDVAFVQMLDDQFQPVRTFTSVEEIAAFQTLWSGRVRVAEAVAMRPRYKIDVRNQDRRGARWLYDPEGFVQVLSKRKTPVYRLTSPAAFNALLGIDASP